MNKLKYQTCDAVKLIRKATDLRVSDGDVEGWIMLEENIAKYDNNDIIFSIRADNENYEFDYQFTKQNLLDATVKDNTITLNDVDDNETIIYCYQTVPVTL